jgi:hypothetical protein
MTLDVNRLNFAEQTIVLEGQPFSLAEYPMYRKIYLVEHGDLLLKCSRQVGKTVTEHNLTYMESIAYDGFRTLYISPSKDQTSRYSKSKYGKTLKASPVLKGLLLDGHESINVGHHLYGNGSEQWFSYAGDDADRIRGISCDRINYDEIQDIPYDGVVPVINECLRASKFKYITYAGTPKSKDNTIEFLWQISTQNEWAVKCQACNRRSIYINTDGIGAKGIICLNKKCGKYVNPYNAEWVSLNKAGELTGYHINQLILPENLPIVAKSQEDYDMRLSNWKRILRKLNSGEYSETAFLNEVVGVSTAAGARLLSLEELEELCDSSLELHETPSYGFNRNRFSLVYAGIDWGGNGKEGVSRSALSIFGLRPDGTQELLCHKIYPIENPLDSLNHMMQTLQSWQVHCIGADAGGGTLANPMLRQRFGFDNVYPISYGVQKAVLEWDAELYQGCYKTNRTSIIDNFALELKKIKKIKYPNKSYMQLCFKDMLALFEEETQAGKKIWQRHPKTPDDSFHSQVYAWTAMRIRTNNRKWYVN